MKSLRGRLTLGLIISLVVLLGLQWSVATVVIERLVEGQLVDRLTQDAENLLSGIEFNGQQNFVLNRARVSAVYQRPFSGHYYVISTATQTEASRSLWDSALQVADPGTGQKALLRMRGPEQQPLLVSVHGYQKQGHQITIAVAEDLAAVNAGLRQFQLIYGAISFFILIVLLTLQHLIVTNTLKPLQRIRDDMRRLERGETQHIDNQGPQEISPLIAELNRLLAAMSKKTRRSREAMGNLAHALKTQLALLNQAIDKAAMGEQSALRPRFEEVSATMHHIVERELKRARLLGASLPGRRIDLQEEIGALVHTLQLMYASKAPIIQWHVADDVSFVGDQEDILELLGNLLDNACKWCRKNVRLEVSDSNGVLFVVEDDGPGCSFDELDALTRRGFKLDESKPGSGLGLAIVGDIVESYGGRLQFSRSQTLGGLSVEVWLSKAV